MMFDSVIERLNLWGDHLARIAWPLFWQSSLLIVGMFLADLFLRRKLRPSVRHALWLVVLVKLLLPPSLALPSGIGWWLRPREAAPAKPPTASYVLTYGSFHEPRNSPASRDEEAPSSFLPVLPSVRLSTPARALLASAAISATLMIIMLVRWRCLRLQLRESQPAPIWLQEIVYDAQRTVRRRRSVRLMLTDAAISPALCGLFRPVIVLPAALVQRLRTEQLRAVLLHELFHLRNRDVWVNCFQSLLQIVFWWHPFLWFANARIRRIREEVVDDAVRFALGEDAENYAPTLLEVARLALARPLATLGLVGILESRHALTQRVDRLVNFPAPRRVGLSVISGFAIIAFASVALPMGQAPPKSVKSVHTSNSNAATMLVTLLNTNELHGMVAEKNVVIQNETNQLTGDKAVYTATNGILELTGNPAWRAGTRQGAGVLAENGKAAESAKLGWDIQPISDNGWIEYDAASGIATTTNGAVVKYGDTTITADHITLNHETGEVVAEGSVQLLLRGAQLPMGSRFSTNVKNLQFAQNQPSVINPTRTIQTSSGRRRIMNKLDEIRLDHVTFDNLPLSEVVNYLRDEAKKRDPEGKGINFLIYPFADTPRSPGAIDPATGLAVAAPEVEPVNIESVTIRIAPPLNDVRMHEVLDAITKVADRRIRYSIEDYGVSFRLAGNEPAPMLFSRVIKVDPNVFAQGLESVVGVSVGNFQTGGQGGGGQGNGSGVSVPRVQVAPNIGGQRAQGGQPGAGGAQSGGGISGVTRPTTMISPQAVRQFFVNAGVDLTPPKSVFFNDRAGTLLVVATLNDLDIIEQAVGALSTSAARPTPASIIETPSKTALPQTNVTKAPTLGDSPIAGKALTRTVEVSVANSPQQIANATGTGEKLLTRIMKIDPTNFRESVKRTAALADKASPQETMDAFRKILLSNGVQLLPPANMFYTERAGSLFVRATAQEMEAIEHMVQQLNVALPQVNIRAKFVEISGNFDADALAKNFGTPPVSNTPDGEPIAGNVDTNMSLITVLADPQYRAIFHALETRDGVDVVSEQNVTTVSGRQAQVQASDVQSIVKLNPQALVSPGVASSNAYVTEPVYSGPVLDIIPYVSEASDKIQLTITAKVTKFVGYDPPESGEAVPVFLDGQATTIKPPHPRTHVRTMQTAAVNLYDGQTVVLGRPKDEMITLDKDGKPISAPSNTKKNLLVFVTATLIDAAGNPVHSNPLLQVPDQK